MRKVTFKSFILPLLLVVCTLFYYFGELVDWATGEALRKNFFYGVHDVHRLLFLAPIVYAGYTARIKGAVIITLISFIIFLPRAFFISPYPDPLLRMVIFTVFAGVIGYLVARLRNEEENCRKFETTRARQKDRMLNVIESMADGVVITDPDYRIRFMNTAMTKGFGEGTASTCYKHLHNADTPCQDCKITTTIKDKRICNWQCRCPDGRTYEVMAAPFTDSDGTVCQISIFRDVSQLKTG